MVRALLEQGRRFLAEAVEVDDALRVRAVASAAAEYARQAKLGREAENLAAELRVRAERKAGELLVVAAERGERRTSSDGQSKVSHVATPSPPLSDIGLSRDESSRFQKLAAVPEPVFEGYVESAKQAGERVSGGGW